MARAAKNTQAKGKSAPQEFLIAALNELRRELCTTLGKAGCAAPARLALAVLLKACFIKLAHERHFVNAEPFTLFKSLMQKGRGRKAQAQETDLFGGREEIYGAIDDVLGELVPDPAALAYVKLNNLYGFLFAQPIDWLFPDLLGTVYEAFSAPEERHARGQYYTAPEIVAELLDALPLDLAQTPDLCLLDPACGSGQFLLGAYDRLKAQLVACGLKPALAHERVIERHLIGFDLDPFAVTLARMNLLLKERLAKPLSPRIYALDSLNREEWLQRLRTTPGLPCQVHAVIGNPPWGGELGPARKAEYRRDYEAAQSGVNSFSLFIERGLELLRPGGHLAFLLPEALLNIKTHQSAREVLLKRAAILKLAVCGELFAGVFAPALMLVARREEEAALREGQQVVAELRAKKGARVRKTFLQSSLAQGPERIFAVHADVESSALLARIAQNAATLKGHAQFHMGIVTGDNARLISERALSEAHEPLLVGTDIEPYRIRFSGHYLVFDPLVLQQAARRAAYDAPGKLVYRFIGKRLVFARDDDARLTLNNVNFLIPQLPGFRPCYVLALLNSSVLQFYYTLNFFTLKVLRGNLERLPLRYVAEERQLAVERLVRQAEAAASEADYRARISEIDAAVAEIYGLGAEERSMIAARLTETLGAPAPCGLPNDAAALAFFIDES